MNDLVLWFTLHTAVRLIILLGGVYVLIVYYDYFNKLEKAGIGVGAGSALLTIPLIWKLEAPFEGWGAFLFSVGVLMAGIGLVSRLRRHRENNEAAKKQAADHLARKSL